MTVRKPTGSYHHGNLREALVASALELIATEGPRALSLRAIARRAGVSTAAPYRHFASREAILAAVAEEGFRTMAADIRAAISSCPAGEPLARFREAGVGYVRFATANPSHYAVMFSAELVDKTDYASLQSAAADAFSLLTEAILVCQRAGLVHEDDPGRLALVAWSVVHGLASLINGGQTAFLGFGADDIDRLSDYVGDRLLSGLGN